MDSFKQIRADISDWLDKNPYAKDVTSGALEVIPYFGPILKNIFERSTKSDDDKANIIKLLTFLQDSNDGVLTGFSDISEKVDDLLERLLLISNVSEEAKAEIKTITGKVDILLQESEQSKAGFWKQFDLALDALEQLFNGHVKLINEAVAPLLEGRPDGLESTAKQFRTLVFNNELPSGYVKAHAHLDEWAFMDEFRSEVNYARINSVRTELSVFEYAVFPMLTESGYFGDFGFGSAVKLRLLLAQDSAQGLEKGRLQNDIRENFLRAFEWLTQERSWHESHGRKLVKSRITKEEYEGLLEITQLNSPDGVLKPVSEWCRQWQYLVNQQLWIGNLEGSIARLREASQKG
jgi:hypothetical protein